MLVFAYPAGNCLGRTKDTEKKRQHDDVSLLNFEVRRFLFGDCSVITWVSRANMLWEEYTPRSNHE